MTYTLLAYKPDSEDVCMGCHMASYSSDFQWFSTEDPEEVVKRAAGFLTDNKFMDTGEAGYELTLLENGQEDDTSDLLNAARAKAEVMIAERKERKRKEKEEAERREQRAALAREREQYEKLKAKFGEVAQTGS